MIICYYSAHLYLVQEHFICETLDVRVNTSLETEGATHVHAPLDMAEIKRYVLDITEGMVAIHSYGVCLAQTINLLCASINAFNFKRLPFVSLYNNL